MTPHPKSVKYHIEMMMLCWKMLELNKVRHEIDVFMFLLSRTLNKQKIEILQLLDRNRKGVGSHHCTALSCK
jgi:hypothetical protein